ncbi:Primase zinc finger, partial [Trichostrongylus colubriformis]
VAPTLFDTFFRLNIRNPKISSSTFESYIDGHKRIRVSDLKLNSVISAESWTTAGVVVGREVRKSANGKDYLIWKIHDLKDCQQIPVVLLLFGEAYKEYWKLQVGICVALMTPMIADSDNKSNSNVDKFKSKTTRVTLKVFKPAQVVELGYSSDLGMCKGVKLDGQKCGNFVNVSLSDYCVHHVMKEARKLSANRGTFNSVTSIPPPKKSNVRLPHRPGMMGGVGSATTPTSSSNIRPTQSNIIKQSELKTTTKAEEKAVLKEIISERAHMFGARNLQLLTNSNKEGSQECGSKVAAGSMADFIKSQAGSSKGTVLHAPKLGYGLCGEKNINLGVASLKGPSVSPTDPARLRAISILKRTKEQSAATSKSAKRQREELEPSDSSKRSKLTPLENGVDLDALLKKKSMHDTEANKAQGIMAQKHLDTLEAKEKVETFVTECMSVSNVKVVSCKKCGYTAQRQSELCMREGHCVTRTTAEKRFFKCGSCQRRTVVFSMMPTKPCNNCDANEWVRVAMKDERKVQLENEKLAIRGEERKFVNS